MGKGIAAGAALLGASLAGALLGHAVWSPRPTQSRVPLYYVDPMHPAYRSSHPGTAPDCGMALVPVYAEDAGRVGVPAKSNAGAQETRQLLGIQVVSVERSAGRSVQTFVGKVEADPTRIYEINLGADAYVRETHDDAVGNFVHKNQHLASVYSPDFLAVAGGYLSATERGNFGAPGESSTSFQNAASAQARADRLRDLGMSDAQIEEITRTRKVPEDIYLVSPADGFIVQRDLSPGMRIERHAALYRIADLNSVWILADVSTSDAGLFRPGSSVSVRLQDSGEIFAARVSDVLPEVDAATRRLKVRLVAANPRHRLRPEMLVDVAVVHPLPAGLSVPVEAVVDSGDARRVYVENQDGAFEPREVLTGWSTGDRVQIVSGLQEGERVVASGTFLIDSETRLGRGAAAGRSGNAGQAVTNTMGGD